MESRPDLLQYQSRVFDGLRISNQMPVLFRLGWPPHLIRFDPPVAPLGIEHGGYSNRLRTLQQSILFFPLFGPECVQDLEGAILPSCKCANW